MTVPRKPLADQLFTVTHVFERRASGYDDGLRGHRVRCRLWGSVDDGRATLALEDGAIAGLCPKPWEMALHGRSPAVVPPLIAHINFVAGLWDEEIVAHEMAHLALHCLRLWPELRWAAVQQEPHAAEELVCYRHGRLVREVQQWLRSVDDREETDDA